GCSIFWRSATPGGGRCSQPLTPNQNPTTLRPLATRKVLSRSPHPYLVERIVLPTLLTIALPLAATEVRLWYALPLIVAVSLVYAATRHEEAGPILAHAFRGAVWMGVLLGIIAGILQFFTMQI